MCHNAKIIALTIARSIILLRYSSQTSVMLRNISNADEPLLIDEVIF